MEFKYKIHLSTKTFYIQLDDNKFHQIIEIQDPSQPKDDKFFSN